MKFSYFPYTSHRLGFSLVDGSFSLPSRFSWGLGVLAMGTPTASPQPHLPLPCLSLFPAPSYRNISPATYMSLCSLIDMFHEVFKKKISEINFNIMCYLTQYYPK